MLFEKYTIDDIIEYVEEGDIVKAYLNKKALYSCLLDIAIKSESLIIENEYLYKKERALVLEFLFKYASVVRISYTLNNNEYIEKGCICMTLENEIDIIYYSTFCSKYNISLLKDIGTSSFEIPILSKYNGYITNCEETYIYEDGDLLYSIKLGDQSSKVNDLRLNFYSLDEAFTEDYLYLSSFEYKINWLVDDYYNVLEGEEIATISKTETNVAIIKSKFSGLLVKCIEENSSIYFDSKLCTIYSTLSEYKKLFPNELLVNKDDFTNSVSITCKKYAGGYSLGFELRSSTYMNFEYVGNKIYLGLRYERKNINLNKKCSLHLLLEDNIVIILTPIANPIKLVNCPSDSILKFSLSPENLKQLEEKKFVKWQIINEDGLQISSGSNQCCCDYNNVNKVTLSLSQEVFQDFVIEFNRLIKENTPEEEDVQEETAEEIASNKTGTCYVYLMIDTTNNFHKIGISNNPRYREHTLQSDKPTIELVAAKEYPTRLIAEAIESALHKVYSSKRIRGEWFNLDENDVAHIVETLK